MKTYFMVIDHDTHRDDDYEICISLEQAKESAQRRLAEAQGRHGNIAIEICENGGDDWCWSAQARCGLFDICIRLIEVPMGE